MALKSVLHSKKKIIPKLQSRKWYAVREIQIIRLVKGDIIHTHLIINFRKGFMDEMTFEIGLKQ